jgi:hypothetical protein
MIGGGMRIASAPVVCLHNVHALLGLLEEERIADGRIPRLCYDALQIVIANGDQAGAKIFTEKAYTARVILKGEDSPESIRLKGLSRGQSIIDYMTLMRWKQALNKIP